MSKRKAKVEKVLPAVFARPVAIEVRHAVGRGTHYFDAVHIVRFEDRHEMLLRLDEMRRVLAGKEPGDDIVGGGIYVGVCLDAPKRPG